MDTSTITNLFQQVIPLLARVFIFGLAIFCLIWLVRRAYILIRLYKRELVFLEVTPPMRTERVPEATEQLFAAIHSLGMSRNLLDSLFSYRNSYSLEIVSTKAQGIRFMVGVDKTQAQTVRQTIISYIPDVKIRQVKAYVSSDGRVMSFMQSKHFAFPLASHKRLEQHDPVGYLTNAMAKLKDDELMVFQVVISPIHSKQADSLRYKILHNDEFISKLEGKRGYNTKIFSFVSTILIGITDAVSDIFRRQSTASHYSSAKELEYQKQVAKHLRPVRSISYFEHELVSSIEDKLSQPLFTADIRLLINAKTKLEQKNRKAAVQSALGLFIVPKYQNLKAQYLPGFMQNLQAHLFARRLPSLKTNTLSASELSSLYHFPHNYSARTENVVKSLSKTLPAPVSLKSGKPRDIYIGNNEYHGSITPIGLTADERQRHIYIIGGTGNGKTTMILYQIIQDIKNGKGIAVVDPHGDLAETILHHIPLERIQDVIYMNPDDLEYPIGINLLELTPGLTGDDMLREKDIVTEATVSVLRKIFSEDDSGGHRIEYVLRNTIQTALTLEDATLFTIFKLLNNAKYRRSVTKNLEDENLRDFWNNELGKAGEFQRVKMAAGITAKIGRFLFSASARLVLEQPKSTISFDDILSSNKILICNFSKGLLGDDTSALFGTTVLAKLQTAALRRARLKDTERSPFYLYVDEFQNFATMGFVQMLSEARKYKLFLVMAEQSTSQQDQQRLVDIILANVGTLVVFRSGSPADERLVLPLFKPFIEEGEIANLPSYSFYVRIAAVDAQEPMSGSTILLKHEGIDEKYKKVIDSSRKLYTNKRDFKSKESITPTKQKVKTTMNSKKQSIKNRTPLT